MHKFSLLQAVQTIFFKLFGIIFHNRYLNAQCLKICPFSENEASLLKLIDNRKALYVIVQN